MSMRSVALRTGIRSMMEGKSGIVGSSLSGLRYFSDSSGRILSEEERAKETVYIQKMERERLEKMKKKAEKEKAEREKSQKIAEEEAQQS